MEGALKIEETLARAATAYEMEEYIHGPCYETTPDRTVMIIDAPGSASSRAYQLYQKLFALTPKTYLITTRKCEGEHVLSLPYPVKEELSVFINIIPFQPVSYTHLDVYKRQDQPLLLRKFRNQKPTLCDYAGTV